MTIDESVANLQDQIRQYGRDVSDGKLQSVDIEIAIGHLIGTVRKEVAKNLSENPNIKPSGLANDRR